MRALFRFFLAGLMGGICHAAPGPGAAGTFGPRRAIVFGIDGCRSDALKLAVDSGRAPNMAGLISGGAVTWSAFAGGVTGQPSLQPTVSGPGWSSVLTGVWQNKHGVTGNDFSGRNYGGYPHFFKHLRASHPESDLSSLVSWPEINTFIAGDSGGSAVCDCHTYSDGDYDQRDAALTARTVSMLQSGNPDVIFHYLGNVDIMGHTYGFDPAVPQYMTSIQAADSRIGQVLAAVRARPEFASEDWLFVVTSDHGGKGTGHGGQSVEERTIPFIASGGAVPAGVISREIIGQVAVPATVYRHLGLEIPASWGWESDAFRIGAGLRAAAGARSVFLSWSLPAVIPPGLSGFELRRNGAVIASPAREARNITDPSPGTGGSLLTYELVLSGTDERSLTTAVSAPETISGPATPPELVLHFDGDLTDSSGHGHDAAAEGGPVFVPGKSGQALSLDGTHSAWLGTVAGGAPEGLRFGAETDFTVSFWFRANAAWSSNPAMLGNKNWSSGINPGWVLAGETNGNDWQWSFKGAAAGRRDFDPTDANISGTVWHLITVSHDRDGDAVFYHDGAEIGRVSIAGAGDADTPQPIRIGRDGGNSYPWAKGAFIDELKIWRRALTSPEVRMEFGTVNGAEILAQAMTSEAGLRHYTGALLGAGDDPDHDGFSNLLEYAGGTSPFSGTEKPLLRMEPTAEGKIRMRFSQRNGGQGIHGSDAAYVVNGLSYALEFSENPSGGWRSVAGTGVQADGDSTAGAAGAGTHEIAVDLAAELPRGFCRLRVSWE